jgi:transcriptional regulator with XRE-family HTH domain
MQPLTAENRRKLGNSIKFFRKKNGLKRIEFGKLIDYSVSTLEKFETGVRVPPLDTLQKIALVLDIRYDFENCIFIEKQLEEEIIKKNDVPQISQNENYISNEVLRLILLKFTSTISEINEYLNCSSSAV